MAEKPRYNSVGAYHRYLMNFPRTGNIQVGRFFTYLYDFSKDYPYKELKYYDFEPLTFIFSIGPGEYFTGINFHHIPVRPRLLWLNRVIKLARRVDNNISTRFTGGTGRPVYRIYGLNYPLVYRILFKSKIAIRRYRFDRVSLLRAIPVNDVDQVMRYYARTYYGVGYEQIVSRYKKYRPR